MTPPEKTLFIGTPSLAAIYQGWKALYPACDATFLGLDGPELAAHLNTCWKVTGSTLAFSKDITVFYGGPDKKPNARKSNSPNFANFDVQKGRKIDLSQFSRIVFVDLFFGLKPFIHVDKFGILFRDGLPFTKHTLADVQADGFSGWYRLIDSKIRSHTDYRSTLPLITAIRKAAPLAGCSLISQPRPFTANARRKGLFSSIEANSKSMELMEEHYQNLLEKVGISYIRQPEDVLGENQCFTANRFSRGPRKNNPKALERHANEDYGKILVRKLRQSFADTEMTQQQVPDTVSRAPSMIQFCLAE